MKMRRKIILTTSLALGLLLVQIGGPAWASGSDFQAWSAVAINGPVKEDSNLMLWFDGHARFRDDASDLGVSIIRPALGWRLNPKLTLWGGYARVTGHRTGPNIEEDRIWQQATYPIATIFGGNLSGRTRLEQRFRKVGSDTGHRFRQFTRWAKPLDNPAASVVIWSELFLGLNDTDWGQRSGYDQHRLFLGMGWQLSDNMRIEGGYLNNHIDGSPGPTNHNISLTIFARL